MRMQVQGIHEVDEACQLATGGGDYVEKGLGLVYGLGLAAGLTVATPIGAPLLAVAGGVGVGFLLYDALMSGRH